MELMHFCFFFSSIRRHTIYRYVTGVQTCALPISVRPAESLPLQLEHLARGCVALQRVSMIRIDQRGCAISGSNVAASTAFESALGAFLGWRAGAEGHVAAALLEAPRFVMAHVLKA